MANVKFKQIFRYEEKIYEKVEGQYRLLSPCLENYEIVTDKNLIARLDKHTATWND